MLAKVAREGIYFFLIILFNGSPRAFDRLVV
jgi:hypothetical protein